MPPTLFPPDDAERTPAVFQPRLTLRTLTLRHTAGWPVQPYTAPVQAPALPVGVAPLPYGAEARSRLDSAVLRIVKNADPGAAADMRAISQGFAAAQAEPQVRMFWTVCAGFFEALRAELDLEALLVTRGEAGVTLLQKGQPAHHQPTRALEVFDVTGAQHGFGRGLPPAGDNRAAWSLAGPLLADPDFAGPGVRRLAQILRDAVAAPAG